MPEKGIFPHSQAKSLEYETASFQIYLLNINDNSHVWYFQLVEWRQKTSENSQRNQNRYRKIHVL